MMIQYLLFELPVKPNFDHQSTLKTRDFSLRESKQNHVRLLTIFLHFAGEHGQGGG